MAAIRGQLAAVRHPIIASPLTASLVADRCGTNPCASAENGTSLPGVRARSACHNGANRTDHDEADLSLRALLTPSRHSRRNVRFLAQDPGIQTSPRIFFVALGI
jgi:hypothetical protein